MRSNAAVSVLALAALGVVSADKPAYEATTIKGHFVEQFTDDWTDRWTPSAATKKTPVGGETFSYVGKWSVEESTKYPGVEGDKGLVAKTKAAHHAISAPFDSVLDPKGKTLVVQYEAKFQKGGNCGGGYLKLLEDGFQREGQDYNDKTPWVVMFGPDLTCPGTKVHFIFRHQNPVSKEWEEKHLSSPPTPLIDEMTKLYTLIVNPDNTYEILIDDESQSKGSLLEDFTPAVNPPAEIDDPEDKKPSEWVDIAKIPDPEAQKPDDWDEDAPYSISDEEAQKPEDWLDEEPLQIPDPDAEKPEEWDDEEDGEWVAPTIPNPKCAEASGCGEWVRPTKPNPDYKGKWSAPLIDNPDYKGPWAARKIANPNYFEDKNPANLNKIGGIGFELWTMTEDIFFDNIYIGNSVKDAKKLAKDTFHVKHALEKAAREVEKPEPTPEDEVATLKFTDAPLEWLRNQAFTFIDLAKLDPIAAFKAKPETGAALVAILLTFLGSFGALFGLIGGSQKSVKV
ncbi:calnexin [Cantharellus anzutake]|uniref:calnexin n=1 Tax=Cantharellus anzutake TaxID=1750568 RepID=UPI001904BAE5|nr:calnexin [Cantharellus anzutake]KAF8333147.1 calnexin [Cantharellus anzutake]